ncbi:DUF1906 domain-containing protein [Niallia circulans]|uniref:DUF1906 domain-containing protein n=1 Tax=Niallia circulans TaxID=1397 RepID=A0A553SMJ9_NIACI|nr:glycoside hydrolase domain-containing protein [Niallia circulans]TRZ38197.1 DUF1906 domain-containing protein [Niallia circulans]
MDWKKYLIIATSAFLIILLGIGAFLYSKSNPTAVADSSNATGNVSTENESNQQNTDQTSSNLSVTNNIQNNVSGEAKADIESSIKNEVDSQDADIKNSLTNSISDHAEVTLTNKLESLLNGTLTGSLNNSINNEVTGTGQTKIENNLINNIQLQVNVDVINAITTTSKKPSQTENSNSSNENSSNEEQATEEEASNENNNSSEEEPVYIWGIDSASETTEEFYACVNENFGNPKVVARYLGHNEGVSAGLTSAQIDLIHENDADVLLIHNGFNDATGYDNGVNEAKEAIYLANELGTPDGVAIFADIEPTYPVDAAFIEGWYDEMNASKFEPGIYGVFDSGSELVNTFNQAAENKQEIKDNTFIWSASPSIGVSTEENAPDFNVDAPEGSLAYGWQYGIDAETCNIDTNLFDSKLTDVLWKA